MGHWRQRCFLDPHIGRTVLDPTLAPMCGAGVRRICYERINTRLLHVISRLDRINFEDAEIEVIKGQFMSSVLELLEELKFAGYPENGEANVVDKEPSSAEPLSILDELNVMNSDISIHTKKNKIPPVSN